MATKKEIVLDAFRKYKALTNIEIQQLVFTTCPHSIIRDIRKTYGYDSIESQECEKREKYKDEKGKEHIKYTQWVRYVWRGDEKEKQVCA